MVFRGFTIEREEKWGLVIYDIYKHGEWCASAVSIEQSKEYIGMLEQMEAKEKTIKINVKQFVNYHQNELDTCEVCGGYDGCLKGCDCPHCDPNTTRWVTRENGVK